MSSKTLVIDPEKCTGCRLCELVCAVAHTGVSNPTKARIHVVKWENEGYYLPMQCQHCKEAPCMAACPKEAIYRDEDLNRVMIDDALCIGCKMCVWACPFGAMGVDIKSGHVFKCDLCDGDPQCVRFCDMKAIDFVETAKIPFARQREAAENYAALMRRHTA